MKNVGHDLSTLGKMKAVFLVGSLSVSIIVDLYGKLPKIRSSVET